MSYKPQTNVFTDTVIKKPSMFAIIMHNDDYTSQEFVVDLLIKIFKKNILEATNIMMTIHTSGSSIVDTYIFDIAITKKMQVDSISNKYGFPLKITIEEVIE